jgi:hypothetical protein
MTGYEVVQKALVRLNYTTPLGDTDNGLNAEHLRRGLEAVNTVLADLQMVAGAKLTQITDLQEDLPLDDKVIVLAAVPGVAMQLAQGESDGDNYNRFATEYEQRRRLAARPHGRVKDVVPWPIG